MDCYKKLQSGQAVIEYLLILLIIVGIVIGLMTQFHGAFRDYVDNYFGEYLACLLETGELPSLGGNTPGVCNTSFQPFTFSSGRPPIIPSTPGPGGGVRSRKTSFSSSSTTRSVGDNKNSSSSSRYQVRSKKSAGRGSGNSSRLSAGGSSSNSASFTGGLGTGHGTGGRGSGGGGGKNKKGDSKEKESKGLEVSAIRGSSSKKSHKDKTGQSFRFQIKGQLYEEEQKEESILSKKSSKDFDDSGEIKTISIRSSQKQDVASVEWDPLNWMDYIRFLIIAIIVIALFILFARQAMQIYNSSE